MIAGTLVAAFLSVAVVVLTPVNAQEPILEGMVTTPDGVSVKSYPVIIEGTTESGDKYNSFVTTDDKGIFVLERLPTGKYTATPAGQPESSVAVSIYNVPWYAFWKTQETNNIGNLSVAVGGKIRPK